MKTKNYYKDTCTAYNRAYHVISFEEYKAKMVADAPTLKEFIIWSWVVPGACNSNALFICSFNGFLKNYGEQCNYCEGIVISKEALNMPKEPTVMAVHHSFIYSNKYECYVDCTPGNRYPSSYYIYLLSDELKDEELDEFIDSLKIGNEIDDDDDDDEEMWNPRFIHEDLPFGIDVPKDWILSNPKHQRD